MKIDLSKYDDPIKYKHNGHQYYYDKVKDILRPATPEEKIRQKVIEYLHHELKIPYEAMKTEEAIAHYKKHGKGRIDIIVFGHSIKNPKVLMIIECKSENVKLTEEVYEQAEKYSQKINVPIYMVTNGVDCDYRKWNDEEEVYNQIITPPTYAELLNQSKIKVKKIEKYKHTRYSYNELYDDNIIAQELLKLYDENFEDMWYLSEYVSPEKHPYILNIVDCFLDTSHIVTDLPLKSGEFIKDKGVQYKHFETPRGNFNRYYRSFHIKDKEGSLQIISFAVTLYNYGKDSSLIVGITNSERKHPSLFLSFSKFCDIEKDIMTFTHSGFCNIPSGIKNKEVREFVNQTGYLTVHDDKIYLGQIDASNLLYVDDNCVKELIANLIEYVIEREKIRDQRRDRK
ncbi:type I restriction enzyme HsdR N-terminal domain-containing protein [Methanosphaera sp.]